MSVGSDNVDGNELIAEGYVSLHQRPFKLRFAPQRQLGRSYVSAVKPMGLPAIVKDKLYYKKPDELQTESSAHALRRVEGMFQRGPREKYETPHTSAQVYGWWWDKQTGESSADVSVRMRHHIQDSAWMKERLRVLATDAGYKRI